MLAKIDWNKAPKPAADLADYSGFPTWNVLALQPGTEPRAADYLKLFNVHAYLPTFQRRVRARAGKCQHRTCAVLPGLLFLPIDYVAAAGARMREMLDLARVRDFMRRTGGEPWVMTKAQIERIQIIESKLNRPESPVDARAQEIRLNSKVRFIEAATDQLFGEAKIVEVVSFNRIGVEIGTLFGRPCKVYVPASEIEVM